MEDAVCQNIDQFYLPFTVIMLVMYYDFEILS